MSDFSSTVDPEGLLEYSVVFTERSLNHMSQTFQHVMRDISTTLKHVYKATAVIVVPGGGTFGMEAVARQFATGRRCMVIRNGLFSYRWTQIFDMGDIPAESMALNARPIAPGRQSPFAPAPLDEVLDAITEQRPDMVFLPHVETSSGIMLPDDYIRAVADAAHAIGSLIVLDCVASGAIWVDMQASGVDILISAPQKGWSASPCSALVMLGEAALARMAQRRSTSFACDLGRWLGIIQAYENGGHAYHATLPTDGLRTFRDAMQETRHFGFEHARQRQLELGNAVRSLLHESGFRSVAAEGFTAPGVVVCYTDDDEMKNGKRFADQGLQIAAGVPLMCDEPDDFKSFRIGLFGLDKLQHVERTVARLAEALQRITRS